MTDIMIDLETLATTPDSHILSIGAIVMNDFDQSFYRVTGTVEQFGRRVDTRTIDWWIDQNQAAQDEVLIDVELTLRQALEEFIKFCKTNRVQRVWSHGATFDIVILDDAFRQYDLKCPWLFWNARDTRTLIDLAKRKFGKDFEPNRQGVYHNALDDSKHQALWMNRIIDAFI